MGSRIEFGSKFCWKKKILTLTFSLVKDTNLKWFQYTIIQRILGTNSLLCKMGIKTDNKCSFCNKEKKNYQASFWGLLQYFWETVILLLVDNCCLENVTFNLCDILFGNPKSDDILNKNVLWGKTYNILM